MEKRHQPAFPTVGVLNTPAGVFSQIQQFGLTKLEYAAIEIMAARCATGRLKISEISQEVVIAVEQAGELMDYLDKLQETV